MVPEVGSDWLEKSVIAGFRVWQLMFMSCAGATVVIVVMCCFMKCRVPRTKQEIEADCHRRELTLQFRKQLNKIAMDDLTFLKALDKVRETFEHEEEKRQRGSWDSLLEQEGRELSFKYRIRKLLRMFRFKKKEKDKNKSATEKDGGGSTNDQAKRGSDSTGGDGDEDSRNTKNGSKGKNSPEETQYRNGDDHRKDHKGRDHHKKDHVEVHIDADADGILRQKS